ncbi:MAG: TIGR02996 domain-containing protein [Planctomycetes bacterium]|nr:TIGR02996 domain-containing protein [Planctomycetota bacterium]
MSDETALLSAICADPADDTARLVFADFLQEHGGKVGDAWARFVRAHVRLGTGTETVGDVPIVQRFGKDYWLKLFAERLGFPAGGAVLLEDWERGFPNGLAADYPVVREQWPVLIERVPFRQLRVGGIEDEAVEDLVMWPRLERLTSLDLTIWDGTLVPRTLSERGIAALTNCPALRGLESLRLSFLDVTDRVADLVLHSRYLTGLRNLVLRTDTSHPPPSRSAWDRLDARFGDFVIQ